jgi:putative flippase GtrA
MDAYRGIRARTSPLIERVRTHLVGQAALFMLVGGTTTLLNAALYILLRGTFTTGVSNVLAVLITTVVSSAAHRALVFADRDEHPMRMHLQTAAVFVFYCVSNNIALWLLGLAVDTPSSFDESAAVSAMAVFGGITRFLALRVWVFARRRTSRTIVHSGLSSDEPVPAAAGAAGLA